MESTRTPSGVLRRALHNTGLLLGGKVFAGIAQLATFALAARGLGLTQFGFFSMILAQVQLVTGLAAFQSNQAIVRYGVDHLRTGNLRGFQALVKAGTLLDIGAALVAMVATIVVAPLLGHELGWSRELVVATQILSLLALTNAFATPKGMLRLFGRFDLLTNQAVVSPFARLAGTGICYALGSGLTGYVVMWLVCGLLGAAAALWYGWREAARRGLLEGMDASLRDLSAQNEGLWKFSIVTNVNSSLALIPNQLSTFLVGALLTPAAAGLFKVARELGTAFARPIDILNQSVFPDIARLAHARDWGRLLRTVVHAGLIAGGVSLLITLVIAAVGQTLITAVFGADYARAHTVLLLISAATTISVLVFAVEPVLYAVGRATRPLVTALVANATFTLLLVWRLRIDGLEGAGWGYLGAAAVTLGLSVYWYAAVLGVTGREDAGRSPGFP